MSTSFSSREHWGFSRGYVLRKKTGGKRRGRSAGCTGASRASWTEQACSAVCGAAPAQAGLRAAPHAPHERDDVLNGARDLLVAHREPLGGALLVVLLARVELLVRERPGGAGSQARLCASCTMNEGQLCMAGEPQRGGVEAGGRAPARARARLSAGRSTSSVARTASRLASTRCVTTSVSLRTSSSRRARPWARVARVC